MPSKVENIDRMPDILYTSQWAGKCPPPQIALPMEDSGSHLIMVLWSAIVRPSPYSKRHLGWFIRFCRDHGFEQQTRTQTRTQSYINALYACDAS